MRDIRVDLNERLNKLISEKESLQGKIKILEEKIAKLEDLIKQEDLFWEAEDQQEVLFPHAKSQQTTHTPLGEFLLSILKDGNSYQLDELLTLARNQDAIANSNYPRRALNFALVGMQRHNLVKKIGDTWSISIKGKYDETS